MCFNMRSHTVLFVSGEFHIHPSEAVSKKALADFSPRIAFNPKLDRAHIQGSYTFASLNSRLESNKEDDED